MGSLRTTCSIARRKHLMQTTQEMRPHIHWRHNGPRQGTQSECGDMLYLDGQKIIDI
jgi:hypothetical protein